MNIIALTYGDARVESVNMLTSSSFSLASFDLGGAFLVQREGLSYVSTFLGA